MKKSFTILELVVVMTITGILVGSTSKMIFNIYSSYSFIRDINSIDSGLSNVAMQIEKILENRVYGSAIDKNGADFEDLKYDGGDYELNKNDGDSLQWISSAFDSYSGVWNPEKSKIISEWSGFLDLSLNHKKDRLFLDDTNISQANETIYYLSNKKIDIFEGNSSALFFKGQMLNYDRNGFGWKESILNENDKSNTAFIGHFEKNSSDENISFKCFSDDGFRYRVARDSFGDIRIYEQYVLSWTAYGLKIESDDNLSLYYNYRPWNGENMERDGTKITLLENVTEFKYFTKSSAINIKICAENKSSTSLDDNVSFCREFFVY